MAPEGRGPRGGAAARTAARHNRALWDEVSDRLAGPRSERRWRTGEVRWGLFDRPDAEVGALGDVRGLDVVELGCGTAELSAALAGAGARPVAVDLSEVQLRVAARHQRDHGVPFPLVHADAEAVPLRDRSFDVVVSEHGAAPWCAPDRWLGEAARLLRPGGRLAFLTTSPLAGLCVPAEGGVAGPALLRSVADLEVVAWPGGGVEHHPGHGQWLAALGRAGFVVDALVELVAGPEDRPPDEYDIVTADWARRWPAEDLWVAHLT